MNVIVIDLVFGVVVGDIGICDGDIVGVGKVGNFDMMDGVDMVVGLVIDVYLVEGKIVIVGVFDIYVYWNFV